MSAEKPVSDTPAAPLQVEAESVEIKAEPSAPMASTKRPVDDEEAMMNSDANPETKRGKFFDSRGGRGPGKGGRNNWQEKKMQAREKNKEKGRQRGGRSGGWKARAEVDEEAALNGGSAAVDAAASAEGEDGDKEKRLPKKRAAVLLGYCGTGYSGMQM